MCPPRRGITAGVESQRIQCGVTLGAEQQFQRPAFEPSGRVAAAGDQSRVVISLPMHDFGPANKAMVEPGCERDSAVVDLESGRKQKAAQRPGQQPRR